jgi:hypothetical protein
MHRIDTIRTRTGLATVAVRTSAVIVAIGAACAFAACSSTGAAGDQEATAGEPAGPSAESPVTRQQIREIQQQRQRGVREGR